MSFAWELTQTLITTRGEWQREQKLSLVNSEWDYYVAEEGYMEKDSQYINSNE